MALPTAKIFWRPLLLSAILVVLTSSVAIAAEPKLIHERSSKYSKILVADDDRGLRTLYFDDLSTRQSVIKIGDPEHLELAYTRTMLVGLAVHDKPQRVLVVGLGGGTLPAWLHRHFPRTLVDVVEIDPEVVDVAKKFFNFRPDEKLKAHVQDGRKFIEQTRDPYDVIFLDAFSADSIPYHLATQEFLKAVRKAIKPDGLVVSNVWSRHSNKLYDSMVKTYQSVFNEVYVVDVPNSGNRILLSLRTAKNLSRQFLADHSHRLFTDQKLTFDLGRLVEQGYEDKLELDSGAILLKDRSPDKPPYGEDKN